MKILYLGYYGTSVYRRNCSPAASTMMEYVVQSIKACGFDVTIISPAQSTIKCDRFVNNQNGIKTVYLPSYGYAQNILKRAINKIRRTKDLYKELFTEIDEDTVMIAYHSLAYIDILKKVRKLKKFRLILQVNEIYADVTGDRRREKGKKEIAWINSANAYLFSTDLLSKEVACKSKPYLVCLGTYKEESSIHVKNLAKEIHMVYAGTFDTIKGGAINAILSAKYLSSNYHLHICGFGNESQIKNIKAAIDKTRRESNCKISYEGCLLGNEYIEMLQKCDIGLCTQNPGAAYNNTSFPSKILSYMSNGLQVISARIPAVESSPVGKFIHYYDVSTPEGIAEGIKKINLDKCDDMKMVIRKLNADFCKNLNQLLTYKL